MLVSIQQFVWQVSRTHEERAILVLLSQSAHPHSLNTGAPGCLAGNPWKKRPSLGFTTTGEQIPIEIHYRSLFNYMITNVTLDHRILIRMFYWCFNAITKTYWLATLPYKMEKVLLSAQSWKERYKNRNFNFNLCVNSVFVVRTVSSISLIW